MRPACLFLLVWTTFAARAEIHEPSPDGKFALRRCWSTESCSEDLIETASDHQVLRVAESEEGGNRLDLKVLWSRDGSFLALGIATNHLDSSISVFQREGDHFVRVKLPPLETPPWPKKYEHDSNLQHVVCLDWWIPVRWQHDGSLVVKGEECHAGNESSVAVVRTVVLFQEKTGRWKVRSSKDTTEVDRSQGPS